MKRKTEKTTILFVNKKHKVIKPMHVSSRVILNWKKYLLVVSFVFLSLIGTIAYLTSNKIEQNKIQEALAKKLQSMHLLMSGIDTNAVREKFSKIDKELLTINGFLKARGVQTFIKGPQGGEADHDVLSTNEITNFYEGYLNRIIYDVSYTPIGLPFAGAITSEFGHRENPFGGADIETHKGLDIKGPIGGQVKAVAKGEVAFAGLKG